MLYTIHLWRRKSSALPAKPILRSFLPIPKGTHENTLNESISCSIIYIVSLHLWYAMLYVPCTIYKISASMSIRECGGLEEEEEEEEVKLLTYSTQYSSRRDYSLTIPYSYFGQVLKSIFSPSFTFCTFLLCNYVFFLTAVYVLCKVQVQKSGVRYVMLPTQHTIR